MKALALAPVKTGRDVLIFEFEDGRFLVVGCDSAGGIGPKPLDKVKVDGYTIGRFTARVALMEVLSTGAKPVCLVDTLSVEQETIGAEIMRGIRDEAYVAGLEPSLAVTGSSEKNIPVEQTGVGVTVVGMARKELLRIGLSKPGDVVVSIGTPCVGDEVVPAEKELKIADISDLLKLQEADFIHEIIPVGSEGIADEAGVMAKESDLRFRIASRVEVDVRKSAGPATVILASLPCSRLKDLKYIVIKPINTVGRLIQSDSAGCSKR